MRLGLFQGVPPWVEKLHEGRGLPQVVNVSSTPGVEILQPNPSPWGTGAKTLILRLLLIAQFGRGDWGVRAIELTLVMGLLGLGAGAD